MSEKRIQLGKHGEDLAVRHLESLHYTILARNFRQKRGEIDIIAQDGTTLVFIEVKTRTAAASYFPAEAVTRSKQMQISRAAQQYLLRQRHRNTPTRFDVIAITLPAASPPQIDHIVNAFEIGHDDW